MIKAIFVDFYGTIVFEDGENVSRISDMIYKSGNAQSVSQIGSYWWESFKIYLKILIMRTFAPSVNLKQFFATCPIPIYVVSNIDRNDVLQAIDYHGLKPAGVFTSEDAKSYKPKR